jgi:hypothetical protein
MARHAPELVAGMDRNTHSDRREIESAWISQVDSFLVLSLHRPSVAVKEVRNEW